MGLINIWVTYECNMNCRYCYEKEKKREYLDKKLSNKIIEFIQKYQLETGLQINFHGGEPLLNFDIIKNLVIKVKRLYPQTKFSLTTNMLLMTKEIAVFIKKENIKLSVSLDGSESINDKNRIDKKGYGTFKRVIKKLEIVKNEQISFRTRMTITPNTVAELYKNVLILKNIGCDDLVATPDLFDDKWNEDNLQILERELKKIDLYTLNKNNFEFSFYSQQIRTVGKCCGGIEEFNIGCDGSIYICTYAVQNPKYIIGNLDIGLSKEKIIQYQKIFQKDDIECRGCTYMKYCISSRCKILNEILQGEYSKCSPIICSIEHIMMRSYQLLK